MCWACPRSSTDHLMRFVICGARLLEGSQFHRAQQAIIKIKKYEIGGLSPK